MWPGSPPPTVCAITQLNTQGVYKLALLVITYPAHQQPRSTLINAIAVWNIAPLRQYLALAQPAICVSICQPGVDEVMLQFIFSCHTGRRAAPEAS